MIYDAHNQASYKLCMRKIIENKKDLDNGGGDIVWSSNLIVPKKG